MRCSIGSLFVIPAQAGISPSGTDETLRSRPALDDGYEKGRPVAEPPLISLLSISAYWSRNDRILRDRDGCFSLRSAFASI